MKKFFIFVLFVIFAVAANAQVSKFSVCQEIGNAAEYGYKTRNQPIENVGSAYLAALVLSTNQMPSDVDIAVATLMQESYKTARKYKNKETAMMKAHQACAQHSVWKK